MLVTGNQERLSTKHLWLYLVVLIGVVIGVSLLWYSPPFQVAMSENDHLIVATWVMAIFTIVIAGFTMLQGRASQGQLKAFREAQTWDRLRVHSEKLQSVLSKWIDMTSGVKPGKLRVENGMLVWSTLAEPSGSEFNALWAHMVIGLWETSSKMEMACQGIRKSSEKGKRPFQ